MEMAEELREEIKLGEIELFLPKNSKAIETARKLLNLFEEGIETPAAKKKAQEVVVAKTKEKFIRTGEIQQLLTAADILIEKFKFDKSQEKSFKNLFYIKLDDGRAVLSYMGGRCYTSKENVLKIPYPVPNGYLKGLRDSPNNVTALRLYREFLATQEGQEEKKLIGAPPIGAIEGKAPPFSSNNRKAVLKCFEEAQTFDSHNIFRNTVDKSEYYEFDGRYKIKREGYKDVVFASKEFIEILKKLDAASLKECIKNINPAKQAVLKAFIEDLKDADAGILQKTKTDTKGSHGEDYEKIEGA